MVAEPGQRRKLTAILSADVVGYSKLMADDEAATVETLTKYRETFEDIVARHEGRVVNAPGDNILAEFVSAVEAVKGAVEIQGEIEALNGDLSEKRRMRFRIGLNLGDVIEKTDGTIYGDGVNIAARMESLADTGGICVSNTIYDAVRGKLELGFEDVGERSVKNIDEPVRVYRVRSEPGKDFKKRKAHRTNKLAIVAATGILVVATAAVSILRIWGDSAPVETETTFVDKPALALPTGPSIAVLPFENLSGNPEHGHFADGLAEDIITDLSQLDDLLVISRSSTFTYKGKSVDVRQVSREMGVRYVMEGSVRIEGDRIRVTAQLIDATTAHHIWAERYDRPMESFFVLQDEITHKIVSAMDVQLVKGKGLPGVSKTNNLEAWKLIRRADDLWGRWTPEDNARGIELTHRAIELDPKWSVPYPMMVFYLGQRVEGAWSKDPEADLDEMVKWVDRGLSVDESEPWVYLAKSYTHRLRGEVELGVAAARHGVDLAPHHSDLIGSLGFILNYAGQSEEAIVHLERAIRLEPRPESWKVVALGLAYYITDRPDEAVAAYKRALSISPTYLDAGVMLAASFVETRNDEQAIEAFKELQATHPAISLELLAEKLPVFTQGHGDVDLILEAAGQAGIK